MTKINLKRTVSAVVIGSMCILAGGTVLADEGSNNSAAGQPSACQTPAHHQGGHGFFGGADQKTDQNLQDVLNEMVSSNTITQDQANAVQQYLKDQAAARQAQFKARKDSTQTGTGTNSVTKAPRTDMFSDMVQKGILTADQVNTLKQQLQQKEQQARQDGMTSKLNALVSAGTITQDQIAVIEKYFADQASNQKADFDKIKSMTADERSAYFEQMKENHVNPLAQMVKDGVITQQQSDAIAKALHPGVGQSKNGSANINDRVKKELDKLVAKNTISQQQADSIQAYAEKTIEAWKASMGTDTSAQDRSAAMEKMKTAAQDLLKQLVNDQVITQDQADAITKYFTNRPHHNGDLGQSNSSSTADSGTVTNN